MQKKMSKILIAYIIDDFFSLEIRIVELENWVSAEVLFFIFSKHLTTKGCRGGGGGGSIYLVPVESIFKISTGVPISKNMSYIVSQRNHYTSIPNSRRMSIDILLNEHISSVVLYNYTSWRRHYHVLG